jgi:DUF4097 and DUF4098 domain-containing protein YvlB
MMSLVNYQDVTTGQELHVWLPFSMGVDVTATAAGPKVAVRSLEGGVAVRSPVGLVELKSMKGGNVNVVTETGDVVCTSLQGNIAITTGQGRIDVGKVQALDCNLVTESGSIMARAVYANSTRVSSISGTITLGAIHGDCAIVSGDGTVRVGTAEGKVAVTTTEGDIGIHLNACKAASLRSGSGDVCMFVLPSARA